MYFKTLNILAKKKSQAQFEKNIYNEKHESINVFSQTVKLCERVFTFTLFVVTYCKTNFPRYIKVNNPRYKREVFSFMKYTIPGRTNVKEIFDDLYFDSAK